MKVWFRSEKSDSGTKMSTVCRQELKGGEFLRVLKRNIAHWLVASFLREAGILPSRLNIIPTYERLEELLSSAHCSMVTAFNLFV
jgi:hypothetical protein